MNINKVLVQNPLSILDNSGFDVRTMQHIIDCYNEPHRYYHDMGHVKEMLAYVESFKEHFNPITWEAIQLAIVWHDAVYDPSSKTNEADSYKDFVDCWRDMDEKYLYMEKWKKIIPLVLELIMVTRNHEYDPNMPLHLKIMIEADLERFKGPFEQFWQNTVRIFKEYSMADWGLFKPGRIAFLESYADKVSKIVGIEGYNNCKASAIVLSVWEPKIAIYAGSFDPFHKGHQRIKEKAERIFDKVIIARGQNPSKPPHKYDMPKSLYATNQVEEYVGWITNYIKSKNYPVTLIRGLRNGSDLNGELNFERYLKDLMPEIQIVSIFADADIEHISSSGIKEMQKSADEGDTMPDYLIT